MRCKECGADVPVLREFCLNCGAPTDPGLRERHNQLAQGRRQRPDGEPNSKRRGLLIAAAVLLGVGMATSSSSWFNSFLDFDSGADDRPALVDRDQPRGAVTIDADQLYKAYRDDPEGAEARFEGREMVVSGEFVRIVPDGYGSLDLRLKTSNPEAEVGVDLAQLAIEDGKSLRPGQRITVSCQGMGNGGDELWVRDCAIQPNSETGVAPGAPTIVPSAAAEPAAPATPAAGDNPE